MGRDVVIRLGRSQAVLLRNRTLASLSPDQFILVPK
jgi:hypothetical protein